jgi:hypothetical protein
VVVDRNGIGREGDWHETMFFLFCLSTFVPLPSLVEYSPEILNLILIPEDSLRAVLQKPRRKILDLLTWMAGVL